MRVSKIIGALREVVLVRARAFITIRMATVLRRIEEPEQALGVGFQIVPILLRTRRLGFVHPQAVIIVCIQVFAIVLQPHTIRNVIFDLQLAGKRRLCRIPFIKRNLAVLNGRGNALQDSGATRLVGDELDVSSIAVSDQILAAVLKVIRLDVLHAHFGLLVEATVGGQRDATRVGILERKAIVGIDRDDKALALD